MTMRIGSRAHLGEADLIRYMDHQMDRDGLRLARTHLAVCTKCTEDLAELQRRSAAVSDLVAALDGPMPDQGKRALALAALERTRVKRSATGPLDGRLWLRAAAIVVVAFGGLIATQPGRATLADGIRRVAGDDLPPMLEPWVERWETDRLVVHAPPRPKQGVVGPQADAAASQQAPSEPAAAAPARAAGAARGTTPPIAFSPAGPDVILTFESLQREGAATVWFREVPDALGQVVRGRRGENLVPNPEGLDVRNRSASRADYLVIVPVRFRALRVRIADGPEMLIPISRSKKDWVWTINLQASAHQQQVDSAAADTAGPGH